MDNARNRLAQGHLVGVFPEGLRGVGKPYRDRYRLSHFGRGGQKEFDIRVGKHDGADVAAV